MKKRDLLVRAGNNLWRRNGVNTIPRYGLVFYAPLWHKELSGSPFVSKEPSGKSCTVTGATAGVTGRTFDGTDDQILVPKGATINDLVTITIIAWFKATGWGEGNNPYVVTKGPKIGPYWATDNGRVYFYHNFSTTSYRGYIADSSIALNNWYCCAITYNNGNVANVPVIYLNGVSKSVTTDSTPEGTPVADAASDLIIGGNGSGGSTFAGIIGDVIYYSRILSAAEVLNIYQRTKWRYA